MGIGQSVTITQQQADHNIKQVKKDEANGHAMSGLDLTDAVTCKASVQQNIEPPPVTLTVKPTPASVDANGIQVKMPTVSVETSGNKVSAVTVSAEQKNPPESSTTGKDTSKQAGTPNMFDKMFKKKPGPLSPEIEANVAAEGVIVPEVQTANQKSKSTPASVEINGIQVKAPAVSVETSGIEVSGVTVSAESSTPAKDTPKPAGTPNVFNKMFKKKSGLLSLEPEANMSAELQTDSQIPKPTPATVDGIQVEAPTVSVETSGIQVSGVTVSADSSTPAKDTPKQVGMFKMFKKKPELVFPEPEANVSAELAIAPKSTPSSIDVNGIQVKAPAVSLETSGIQVSGVTASAESSTPAKDTPKPAGTPKVFNKMFKKKPGLLSLEPEANMSAELQTDSQIPKLTPATVDINGIQIKAPAVSVETSGIQVSGVNVTAESSTPAKDTPKPARSPNVFNKMFKKKPELVFPEPEANVSAELQIDNQIPKPTPATADINNSIQVKAPAVSVETSGIQVSGVTVSAESSTPAKDTPKPAGTPNVFNKMFKKKSEILSLEPEANMSAELQTDSQIPKLTPATVDINGIQVKAPAVSVETSGIQVSGVTVSAESCTPAKDTPKPAGTPNVFNKMFKKKSEILSLEPEANMSAELQTDSQIPKTTPDSVDANGIQVKAPTVSVETSGIQVSGVTVSAESSTPAKDTPKPAGTPNVFNKMFKKKSGILSLEPEANMSAELQTDSQIPKLTPATVDINGIQVKAPAVSVETSGIQVSGVTVSAESSTPAKDTPKPAGTPNVFNKMFKKKSEILSLEPEANMSAELQTDSQIPKTTPDSVDANGIQVKAPTVSVETSGIQVSGVTVSAESSTPAKDTPKPAGTPNVFNKMFKKKSGLLCFEPEANVAAELQTDSQIPEPTDIKASTQPEKQPQGEDPTEVTQDSTQPEQTGTEENSVMNFFKTLVSSTKTTKDATASPDVSKEQQSHKETPPAPAANLQEASKIPPPPPPAPPKMESKAETAVKKEEAPVAEAAAGVAKEPETPSKAKTKDKTFGKLFRTKVLLGKKASKGGAKVPAKTSSASAVKEEAKPVQIQVDPSKTSTLEAGAKPEPPPAPKPEGKKAEKKPSPFANLLKPKVLLGQVSSRIHAAASSVAAGISLGAGGAATEFKKEATGAPTAPAEAGPNTKAKEEPKPAAVPAVASSDNKSVGSTDNSSPSSSRKLEKRNSIHLFFKNLGQKRHSDAGVQTEPVAPEKAK